MTVKTFEIDASLFGSRRDAHTVMKTVFEGYEYYGNSLDALHDVLTSVREDARIVLKNTDASREVIDGYIDRIIKVMRESAEENPHLEIVIE